MSEECKMSKMPTRKAAGNAKKSKAVVKTKKADVKAKSAASSKLTSVPTKTQILERVAEKTELSRKQVGECLISLEEIMQLCLKKSGPGAFVLPGLLKCYVVHKPATKARKGINPFNGEPAVFKAKPARNVIKIKALKKLKEMVA
jgi:nucleoid DNA-binding protein